MYNRARRVSQRGALRLSRNLFVAACLVAASVSMYAQAAQPAQLPDAPAVSTQVPAPPAHQDAVVFHKKVFWTLVGVDAASAVADTQTSWHNEQMNAYGVEQNSWLYGRRPSLGRYYATDVLMDGGGAFLSYRLLRSQRRIFRIGGWALLGALIGQHTDGWIYNVSGRKTILPAPPQAQ